MHALNDASRVPQTSQTIDRHRKLNLILDSKGREWATWLCAWSVIGVEVTKDVIPQGRAVDYASATTLVLGFITGLGVFYLNSRDVVRLKETNTHLRAEVDALKRERDEAEIAWSLISKFRADLASKMTEYKHYMLKIERGVVDDHSAGPSELDQK
jgi:hypothetical protein